MPAKRRSDVVDPSQVGIYHCWNRLVRRRHLFGKDDVTGKDFSYRKHLMRDRLKQLAGSMAIEVLDFAILDNHLHVVLRSRPDIVAAWSDEEVAMHWWYTCPDTRNPDGSVPEPKPCQIQLLLQDVDEYRKRLSNISWMMRLACQTIASRANREDGVDGRFFAKRFDCERLETEEDVLNCSLYVNLNWIRAGMAETPEQSEFTSAYERIQARWQSGRRESADPADLEGAPSERLDDWLAPVSVAEGSASGADDSDTSDSTGSSELCNPLGSARISNKGFLSLTFQQYLTLLDTLGRTMVQGKRGSIPTHLSPILERLGIPPQTWFDRLLDRLQGEPPRPSPDILPVPG